MAGTSISPLLVVAVTIVGSFQPPVAQEAILRPVHVRSVDVQLLGALHEGIARSTTLRNLAAHLEASDVIVYLQEGRCPNSFVACLMLLTPGPTRMLRVNFVLRTYRGPTPLLRERTKLIAQIAHELQHAAEVADATGVVDERSLEALYGRIGDRRSQRIPAYETEAALTIAQKVLAELVRP